MYHWARVCLGIGSLEVLEPTDPDDSMNVYFSVLHLYTP